MQGRRLLTREGFREGVLARDGGRCVLCGTDEGLCAHHVFDRALFPDGGYYLDNGATVCEPCHVLCESTEVSVERVLEACGIARRLLPPHLADDGSYDKWGNPVLPDGRRLVGEMFHEEGVRKMLALSGALERFTHHVKYPRTFHFPWSASVADDDKVLGDLGGMSGREVVATLKKDGECTTLYRDHMHARSLDGRHHPSRDWVKGLWSSIRHDIPERWRVCGENLFAVHSIEYAELPSWFMGFSVWNDRNVALSWDETLEWFDLLGIVPVEEVWRGTFDEDALRRVAAEAMASGEEGIVVRVTDAIPYRDFRRLAAKAVRENHVTTDQHWMHGEIRRNGLAAGAGPKP